MNSTHLSLCIILIINILITASACLYQDKKPTTTTDDRTIQLLDTLFLESSNYITDGFDFPVGKPNAKGYYNAQPFGKNNHLGDDWNATTGGNSDLGDPIYSIANGYIVFAKDIKGGWGKVVRIIHKTPNHTFYESLYAHCDSILVKEGTYIKKGEQIATIGNAGGIYYAHLHLEIRDSINMPIGGGYSANTQGYLDPTIFIEKN